MACLRLVVPWKLEKVKRIIALSLLLSAGSLQAQQPPPASPPPPPKQAASDRPSLVSRPPLDGVAAAFSASGKRAVRALLVIDYDDKGVPTRVRLDPASGVDALDQAILAWGRAARLTPGEAGTGRLPFDLKLDDEEGGIPQGKDPTTFPEIKSEQFAVKPSLEPIHRAVAAAGFDDANAVLVLAYDAAGRVTEVQMVRSSGSIAVDATIIDWTKHLLLKPGAAGYGRLPFSFKVR